MNKNALSSFVSWLKTVVEGVENVILENENNLLAYARLSLWLRVGGAGLTR